MVEYVYRDGARLTPRMLYQINRLDADFFNEFGLNIKLSSGIRTAAEQLAIWYERYTTNPGNRRVYDKRYWRGQWWYRISPEGTVAQPGSSNHEIQGNKAAVDLYDTGSDAGVTVASSERGRWLRQNAHKYDLVASGDSFGEGWHFDILNIFAAVPSGGEASPFTNTNQEEDMPIIIVQKKDSNAAKGMMTHNRRMRLITKYENTCYRAAQAQNPDAVIYVTVSDSDFNNLLAGHA